MISVAIVDDDKINRLLIKHILLRRLPFIFITAEEESVAEAIRSINRERPDLIFLDIKLKDGTGFDVLDGLLYRPKIIFTTAYSEFALQAIKVKAFGYLLKPIDEEELIKSLEELRPGTNNTDSNPGRPFGLEEDFFHYATSAGKVSLKKSEILYFRGSGAYTYIITENQKILISRGLGELEVEFNEHQFYRTHNSYIVNVSKIKSISVKRNGLIILVNNSSIPLSQRRAKGFVRLFGGKN